MKMNRNTLLYDLYLKLMEADDRGKYVWEKVRDKELTVAPCFEGDLFKESDAKLMVVGRAVNGWEMDFGECSDAAVTTTAVLSQSFSFDDVVNSEGIPYPEDQNKRNYKYHSSNFWRLIKFLLEQYGESEPTNDAADTWYTDKYCWHKRIVWSNLYKVAPRKTNNPEWALVKPQMQVYIDMLKREIELYNPERILFVTNADYMEPWKRQPSFAKELGINLDPKATGAVVGTGTYCGKEIVVCKRPDIWGMSHEDVAKMAAEIKAAFDPEPVKE